MTMAMAVSFPASKKGSQLRGPRPQRLKVSSSSSSKKVGGGATAAPVIVYEHTPKVVHARPHEFMTVVQRLTGMSAPATCYSSPLMPAAAATATYVNHPAGFSFSPVTHAEEGAGGGPDLLLTLGQRQAPMAAAGMLLSSPGGFIFSPNTMRSIQELTPLF